MGKEKCKILCLHGYRQNAQTFKEKLGAFRKSLKKDVEFYFIDAPHKLNDSNDERSWWFTKDDSTFSSSQICDNAVGLELSIEVVKNFCQENDPFDGLLGFSQGAAFATILCSLINQDKNYFKFVILIAGFKSLVSSHRIYYEHVLQVPSLHVIGESDTVIIKRKSEELRDCYDNSLTQTITHEGGHYVPFKKEFKLNYLSFINAFS